ncbi:1-acyl-sn-glycerol-3-phosphate acyltransferase [Haliea sp. E1-2-M8]|uniref:1-acyl-sn-glycerol-3-phosphate acyltransferase n=1 Tax=Haliea sp. E1-2-M8 TaxID=3064706 RepID=UPI002722C80C|nr:1-acyl-sn-glycerol-3-phosphate acyltransferase [Haliea sp. E1-2-M8]MDO8861747.1 1-acyl-sn-glycerol-3-phosphate acyltransferase [Haliea sp. E1-2-M8]
MNDPFADIRPYRDAEVPAVVRGLLGDRELLDAIARLRLGKMAALAPALCRPAVRWYLGRQLRGVSDVHGMQMVIKHYVEQVIADSTAGFSVSGLDELDTARPWLFMSNHRDIVMDPAFTNYALHRGGHQTVRIAIGDNLLTKPWVSDLMRLNKSFIVKRSHGSGRQLLAASRHLANYIRMSLQEERAPVWIAQREGRAKDGVDRTEPAVIKMLAMSRDKQAESFSEVVNALGIVPVSISYELDPCDGLKARELYLRSSTGSYAKAEQEDVASIARGIAGDKGRVHVAFGTPLVGEFADADQVAAAIDRQVVAHYCLHPTNLYAYRMLHGNAVSIPDNLALEDGSCSRAQFEARIEALPVAHRPFALAIYGNAVTSKLGLAGGGECASPC